ncbi:methyl-accepting chemotaxis protein [Halobium palmae]|uniref:Methyl-accepting chemotaxis protein n=1 Tax=Halobium palmae TaxID=1776492 RepID=A0ABD5RWD0_9EURY
MISLYSVAEVITGSLGVVASIGSVGRSAPTENDVGDESEREASAASPGGDGPGEGRTDEPSNGSTADSPAAMLMENERLADAIPLCVFVLGPDHEVRIWNREAETLCGTPREEVVGTTEVSVAFYQDGRRAKTLADKVVDAPETAAEEYGVNRSEGVRYTRYEDTSTMKNARGEEVEIWFTATPVYDDDGTFLGVVEMVQDRSDLVAEQRAVESLVGEVNGTLSAIGDGDLGARASFEDAEDVLDRELLDVIDATNEMAAGLESVVRGVGSRTEALVDDIEETAETTEDIRSITGEQREDIRQVVNEMGTLSANMEEVAASAQQVSSAANQAKSAAEVGQEAGTRASTATEEMIDTGQNLVDQIETLESHIESIVDVVDVIADVADQTNLLALNANIEAARVGADGSGFEVVADEVKSLAEETRSHTEEITERIDRVQSQTETTVDAVEDSNEQIHEASDQIADAITSLTEIADAVDEVANGIEEVASANDQQAATVEEVTSLAETVEGSAEEVDESVKRVADTAASQKQTVRELADRVHELSDPS